MKNQVELSDMLIGLAKVVRGMPDDQFARLVKDGAATLSRPPKTKNGSRAKQSSNTAVAKVSPVVENMWEGLLARLRVATSRDEGHRIIEGAFAKKDELLAFAKHLDLPVQKRDNTDHIRRKVVDFMVGRRLASEAIRGGYSID